MSLFAGFIFFAAGLSVGLSGLAAGFAIGVVGDAGVRGSAQQPKLFVGMILILIFAEVLVCCCFAFCVCLLYVTGTHSFLTLSIFRVSMVSLVSIEYLEREIEN